MSVRVSLKDLVIGTLWGNTFYRRVLQPFDLWHVEPQPSAAFETADLALNKVCRLSNCGLKLLGRSNNVIRRHDGHRSVMIVPTDQQRGQANARRRVALARLADDHSR